MKTGNGFALGTPSSVLRPTLINAVNITPSIQGQVPAGTQVQVSYPIPSMEGNTSCIATSTAQNTCVESFKGDAVMLRFIPPSNNVKGNVTWKVTDSSGASLGCGSVADSKACEINLTTSNNPSVQVTFTSTDKVPPPDILGTWTAHYWEDKDKPLPYTPPTDNPHGFTRVSEMAIFYSDSFVCFPHVYTWSDSPEDDGSSDCNRQIYAPTYTYDPNTPNDQIIYLATGINMILTWQTDHWEMNFDYFNSGYTKP